jgi:hypothetical protein
VGRFSLNLAGSGLTAPSTPGGRPVQPVLSRSPNQGRSTPPPGSARSSSSSRSGSRSGSRSRSPAYEMEMRQLAAAAGPPSNQEDEAAAEEVGAGMEAFPLSLSRSPGRSSPAAGRSSPVRLSPAPARQARAAAGGDAVLSPARRLSPAKLADGGGAAGGVGVGAGAGVGAENAENENAMSADQEHRQRLLIHRYVAKNMAQENEAGGALPLSCGAVAAGLGSPGLALSDSSNRME